jgi:hypothetical protein
MASVLAGCAQPGINSPTDGATSMPEATSLGFEISSSSDQVEIVFDNNVPFFEVHSPSGIGSTRVVATQTPIKGPLGVRLYLAGLENLTLVYDKVILTMSVSSADPELITRSMQIGSVTDQDISQDSPYWMDVQQSISSVNQEPYFAVSLPDALFQSGATEFELSWIDFYR